MGEEYRVSKILKTNCCAESKLNRFKEETETCISKAPGWQSVGQDSFTQAVCSMMSLTYFCGCKLMILGEIFNNWNIWRFIIGTKRLSVDQIRYIGERQYMDWFNLDNRIKECELLGFFDQRHTRQDVLNYMKLVPEPEVIAAGIYTKTLLPRDIRSLAAEFKGASKYAIVKAIIESKILTQNGVIDLLTSYDGLLEHQIQYYLDTYQPRGKKLENFITEMVKLQPKNIVQFWNLAFSIEGHRMSSNLVSRIYGVKAVLVATSG